MAKAETASKTRPRRALPALIECALHAAGEKKAADIALLDLRKASAFTDYFVICSGQNARQIRAVADAVIEALAARGTRPSHVEGYERSEWVLIDYFDFVVHIFSPEARLFFGLERLWGSAEHLPVPASS
jgi:ribosome-associated protein